MSENVSKLFTAGVVKKCKKLKFDHRLAKDIELLLYNRLAIFHREMFKACEKQEEKR